MPTTQIPPFFKIHFFFLFQPFDLYMVFNSIHLWAALFAVIIINYTFQDGKSDYFQGLFSFFICCFFFV